jgi:hypothetical protein
MIQPQATVIGETTGADGYYDVVTSNGSTVSAVSILRATMTAGQTVTVIQCGDEYGVIALDKGLRGALAVLSDARSTAESQGSASVALSSIGRWASLVQRIYVLGQVVSVGAASLVVDLLDGPFQGQRITTSVDTLLGIAASDFVAGDEIVLRAWPDAIPTVVGWWEIKPVAWVIEDYSFLPSPRIDLTSIAEGGGYLSFSASMPPEQLPTRGIKFIGETQSDIPDHRFSAYVVGHGDTAGKTMRGFGNSVSGGEPGTSCIRWLITRSDIFVDFDLDSSYFRPEIEFGPVPLGTPYLLPVSRNEFAPYDTFPAIPGVILNSAVLGDTYPNTPEKRAAMVARLRIANVGDPYSSTYARYWGI